MNMQRFGGVVGCFTNKALLAYPTLKIICFIVDDAPKELQTLG
jgi:hypothetical protein